MRHLLALVLFLPPQPDTFVHLDHVAQSYARASQDERDAMAGALIELIRHYENQ